MRGGRRAGGLFYEPTLIEPTSNDAEIVQNEVFGPVLTFQTLRDRGGGDRARQLHALRALGHRLHRLAGARGPRRPGGARRHGVGQHLPRARPHGAVRRRGPVGHRARGRRLRARLLLGPQDPPDPGRRRCRDRCRRHRMDGGPARRARRGVRRGTPGRPSWRARSPTAASTPVDVPLDADAIRADPHHSPFSWSVDGKRNVVANWHGQRRPLADPQRPRRRRAAGLRGAVEQPAVRAAPRRRLALRARGGRHEGRARRHDRRGARAPPRRRRAARRPAAAVGGRGGVHGQRHAPVPAGRRARRRLRDHRAAPRPLHGRAGRRAVVPRRRARRAGARGAGRPRRVRRRAARCWPRCARSRPSSTRTRRRRTTRSSTRSTSTRAS